MLFEKEAASPPRGKSVVFIVDDQPAVRTLIRACLTPDMFEVVELESVDATAAALEEHTPDLIFLDLELGTGDAIETMRVLAERKYTGTVQLMSGRGAAILEVVQAAGARYGFRLLTPLSKPFRVGQIRQVVAELQTHAPTQVEPASLAPSSPAPGPRFGLDEAIEQNWLELWYQPKFDLRTSRIVGAEGLIRARHPTQGVVGPFAFLPGASDEALANLTERVLLGALQDWDGFYEAGAALALCVNVPASALLTMPLAQMVRENRPQSDAWNGLILEVTEDQILPNIPQAQEIAAQLQIYGVSLSLDDFGQGYSSLARLRDLPFRELKIDRSFVDGCASDVAKADLCRTIVEMSHRFGCAVVAEGLEVPADFEVIKAMGCDYGQGYLLARPMPKENLIILLSGPAA